jgi:hypothetical protein
MTKIFDLQRKDIRTGKMLYKRNANLNSNDSKEFHTARKDKVSRLTNSAIGFHCFNTNYTAARTATVSRCNVNVEGHYLYAKDGVE